MKILFKAIFVVSLFGISTLGVSAEIKLKGNNTESPPEVISGEKSINIDRPIPISSPSPTPTIKPTKK